MKDCNNDLLLELNENALFFRPRFWGQSLHGRAYDYRYPEDYEVELYIDKFGSKCALVGPREGFQTFGYKNSKVWGSQFIFAEIENLKITPASGDTYRLFSNPRLCKKFLERCLEEEEKQLLKRKTALLKEYYSGPYLNLCKNNNSIDIGIYSYKEITDMYNKKTLPDDVILSMLRLGKRFNLIENVEPVESSLINLSSWRGAKLIAKDGHTYYTGAGYYSFKGSHTNGNSHYNEGWALFKSFAGAYTWRRSILKENICDIDKNLELIKKKRNAINRDLVIFN